MKATNAKIIAGILFAVDNVKHCESTIYNQGLLNFLQDSIEYETTFLDTFLVRVKLFKRCVQILILTIQIIFFYQNN